MQLYTNQRTTLNNLQITKQSKYLQPSRNKTFSSPDKIMFEPTLELSRPTTSQTTQNKMLSQRSKASLPTATQRMPQQNF